MKIHICTKNPCPVEAKELRLMLENRAMVPYYSQHYDPKYLEGVTKKINFFGFGKITDNKPEVMVEIKTECACTTTPRNEPKTIYVIRRRDGGYTKAEMYFTLYSAQKWVRYWKDFYRNNISGRKWEDEHYLVECEVVEKRIIE